MSPKHLKSEVTLNALIIIFLGYTPTFTTLVESKTILGQHGIASRLLSDQVRRRGLIDDPTLDSKSQFLFDDIDISSAVGVMVLCRALGITKAQ